MFAPWSGRTTRPSCVGCACSREPCSHRSGSAMTISRFAFPTTIHFGAGASRLVGPHLKERGLARPLVVTDKGLAALPLLAEFVAGLSAAGLQPSVYGGVFGNPTGSQVMNGAAAYKAHDADCV